MRGCGDVLVGMGQARAWPTTHRGVKFEIRVAGPVAAHVLVKLENIRVVSEGPETVLRGPVRDQAALVGIINRLHGCGIELRGIRQL